METKFLRFEPNRRNLVSIAKKMHKIKANNDIIQDGVNIVDGVYAPLRGFLGRADYRSVLDDMRLADGSVWSIPIVLDISASSAKELKAGESIILIDAEGEERLWLEDIEIYEYNKQEMARKVFGTRDLSHPGVAGVMAMQDYLLGGRIVRAVKKERLFLDYYFTPAEIRKQFQERGWKKIVAFQTRNVPHRGHEFLQHYALGRADGLLVQPVIGEKKLADFKDEFIISAYKILIEKYFPKDKVILSVLPLRMRYAGPREALMHALIRRNYGCSHFIVGRDHAGVGSFYAPEAAQEIFNQFRRKELGIEILKFDEVVYDKERQIHCFARECKKENQISFSGTKLREYIEQGQAPPGYLLRSEIYDILVNSNSLIDNNYMEKKYNNKQGFVLWLTGLSAAGKTTIADAVYEYLNKNGIHLERLDGDAVRENLTKDLGFSKEDRDENIRRIGFAAGLLSKNNVGVIASFISPYRKQREELKAKAHNFVEIFIDTPLELCEQRDPKGMYKKARSGEIKQFTGVSDPYEVPENPDIHIKSGEWEIERSVDEIVKYLRDKGYIE
ncbi:MAG: sulfate adenylyltransferase [Patescibacteria group bacterium]|nr:sulfate adenylyltransferase [Patescibacteria group bacterium]